MAGKTLPGIGEDESGEHEVGSGKHEVGQDFAADMSDSGVRTTAKPMAARSTDRMPLSMPTIGGATNVDDDKVAEGLKKLRSLDEPLGSLPASMPTLKEGMPVVGGGTGAATPVTPAVAAAELLRSRGTAHGHALSTPSIAQSLLPATVDDRMKGTLLGHSLHLPDLPEPAEDNRPAEVRSVALERIGQVGQAGSLRQSEMHAPDFSHGDARFFESEPFNAEMEPEPKPRNLMFRGVVFFAVISVFVVAAFAWVNARKSDSAEVRATPPPAPAAAPEGTAAPATPPPAGEPAAENAAAPGVAAVPGASSVTPPAIVPLGGTPATAGAPTAAAAAPAAPAAPADEGTPEESPTAKLKRELAAAEEAKAAVRSPPRSATRPSRHTDSPRVVPPPAAKTPSSGKHGKVAEDPDGTLPLSD